MIEITLDHPADDREKAAAQGAGLAWVAAWFGEGRVCRRRSPLLRSHGVDPARAGGQLSRVRTSRSNHHPESEGDMAHDRRLHDTTRWRKCRKIFLAANPVCVLCERRGITTAANVVDHIRPHGGDPELFWDTGNWQPLCTPCHNSGKKHQEHKGVYPGCDTDGLPLDGSHHWGQK